MAWTQKKRWSNYFVKRRNSKNNFKNIHALTLKFEVTFEGKHGDSTEHYWVITPKGITSIMIKMSIAIKQSNIVMILCFHPNPDEYIASCLSFLPLFPYYTLLTVFLALEDSLPFKSCFSPFYLNPWNWHVVNLQGLLDKFWISFSWNIILVIKIQLTLQL